MQDVWKIIKETRFSLLFVKPDQDCNRDKTLVSDGNIQDILNNLAAKLKLNLTSNPNKNVSDKILETAAKMFTYLNFCPSLMPKHNFLQAYLFKTGTPTEIILALISMMKTSQNVDEKGNIIEVFGTLMGYLKLESYKEVQSITKRICYLNDTFGICKTNINSNEYLNLTSNCFHSEIDSSVGIVY